MHVLPLLQMGVTVDGTGSAGSRTGVATISGVVTCSRAIGVGLSGTLSQLFANRVLITGSYGTYVNCSPPSVNWTANVTASNGQFAAGPADASVNAFGCELSCHSASATQKLRLNATK